MRELDEILDLRRDIASLEERLTELIQITQPKALNITGMPSGGERKNAIEEYIIKSEKIERKIARKERELSERWAYMLNVFGEYEITPAQIKMLEARFYSGLPWRSCVKVMRAAYPDAKWDEQKLFRTYRKVLCKMGKYGR